MELTIDPFTFAANIIDPNIDIDDGEATEPGDTAEPDPESLGPDMEPDPEAAAPDPGG